MTLLKNTKPHGASAPLLPLSKSRTVAVIGPASNFAPAGRLPVTMYPADYTKRNMTDY